MQIAFSVNICKCVLPQETWVKIITYTAAQISAMCKRILSDISLVCNKIDDIG